MGNLMFSPSGRIGPQEYFKGMMILAVISAIINLVPLISVGLGTIVGFLAIVLIIPFIFLGIKRSHDAGKSGWMVLTHILLAIGVSVGVGLVLKLVGLGGPDLKEVMAAAENGEVFMPSNMMYIGGAISSLIGTAITAYLVNMFNPHDPSANQYGGNIGTDTFS